MTDDQRDYLIDHVNQILQHAATLQRGVAFSELVKHPATAIRAHADELYKALTGDHWEEDKC